MTQLAPDDVYVPVKPPSPGGRRLLTVVGGLLLLAALLAGLTLVWAMRQLDPPGEPGAEVGAVSVPEGAGVDRIGDLLESRGVIRSATVFGWYVRWRNEGSEWRAGDYVRFRRDSSVTDAIKVLDAGPVPPQAVVLTVPPGVRLADAFSRITKAFPNLTVPQLQAALDSGQVTSKYRPPGATSWEGLLAPDTYEFEKDANPVQILQRLATQMDRVLDGLEYQRAEALTGRSAYDLITIASLIERETGTPPDEMGKISRVIDNRLARKEPLGIDASVLYGLGRSSGGLTKTDLETDTPYNTRKRAGLPPTPIALPSKAALAAAIEPTPGPWMYYVLISNDPPTHLFTDSAREFERAKEKAKAEGVF